MAGQALLGMLIIPCPPDLVPYTILGLYVHITTCSHTLTHISLGGMQLIICTYGVQYTDFVMPALFNVWTPRRGCLSNCCRHCCT
jgi:hypothetical protein